MEPQQAKAIARFLAATPRRPENIVFIGRSDGQFSGNAKYMFLHCVENVPQCKSVFVTLNAGTHKKLRSAGLPSELFPRQEAINALAEASVVMVDDFQFRENGVSIFTLGAKIVQMWHGVGFKKIGFIEVKTSLDLTPERRAHLTEMYSNYDAVLSTSPFYTEHLFKTSFGAKEIWETGYPRNDVLLRKCAKRDLIGCDMEAYNKLPALRKKYKTCLYAPTFRDDNKDPFIHGALELNALSAFLERENIFLFLKMHPFSADYKTQGLANIDVIANDSDVYPLLPFFDGMITDYSSLLTDYLHLDRPIVFFPYDKADYETRLREFQFEYDAMTPGPKCFTQEELLDGLRNAFAQPEAYAGERKRLRDLAFSHHDALASARAAEHVLRLAGAPREKA